MSFRLRRSPPPTKPAQKPGTSVQSQQDPRDCINTKRGTKCPTSPQDIYSDQDNSTASDANSQISDLLATQAAQITKILNEVAQIKQQNIQIQKTNENIEASMLFINQQYESLKLEVELLKKESLSQTSYIDCLEQKVKDLQNKTRSSTVEIRNIPQLDNESTESLMDVVVNIGKITGVNICKTNLRDIHRLPGNQKKPRPIIVEFMTVQSKSQVLTAARNYNKDKKNDSEKLNTRKLGFGDSPCGVVHVSEQLPATTKKLLYLAQEFKKKHAFAYCWIKNGNVFMRKVDQGKHVLIKSEQCLQKLATNPEFINSD